MKRFISLFICMVTIFALNVFPQKVNAQYSYISFSSGGSGYSSETDTIVGSSNHSTYYVKLDRFKFSSNQMNVMPNSGALIHARAYKSVGTNLTAAGNLASFSMAGNGYYYSYWSGFGKVGEVYKLKSNSNVSDSCTACFVWHA